MTNLNEEAAKRRTFAIISHPDAGKTTLTEKLLLFGNAISMAGTVKGRKADRHAHSDWMEMEQQRGISVTTSVMQFPYHDRIVNLLDTPGHEDFSEDTYRTLTAVDSALMVIDVAKGVEARTIKLMEVCRMRDTPIMTFINKLDREGREPLELLDEIERVLKIRCAPVTWPIGMGRRFKGIYHLRDNTVHLYESGKNALKQEAIVGKLEDPEIIHIIGKEMDAFLEELAFVQDACEPFDLEEYRAGKLTPVFFGSAINNFGIAELLDDFVEYAPPPTHHETNTRDVQATEEKLSGFVFKIQANMDPNHRDRIAFMRLVSGEFNRGMKFFHTRTGKQMIMSNAVTFMAGDRSNADTAYPGDIIGLHNHGGIQIGDTFTQGEMLKFSGIPNFAPELFRRVILKDPLKSKALVKGLIQLSEEGATQVFRPIISNDLILGAVGVLQFDVVAFRLQHEYKVECIYEPATISTVRWIECDDPKMLEQFKIKLDAQLAYDGADNLTFLATSNVNLNLTMERWPDIRFLATREH